LFIFKGVREIAVLVTHNYLFLEVFLRSLQLVINGLIDFIGVHFGRLSAANEIASLVTYTCLFLKVYVRSLCYSLRFPQKSGTSYETALLFASLMRPLR